MKRYANEAKWSQLYISLDEQAKDNIKIISYKIPEDVPEQEINEVIQELRSLYNFKNYLITQDDNKIKGVRYEL
jgi:hypothetical protein